MPKINIGKLRGSIKAGPIMLFFPRDKAPDNAPNKHMVGVPTKRLKITD